MKVTIFGDSHVAALRFNVAVLAQDHEVEFSASHGQNWLAPTIADEAGGIRVSSQAFESTPLDVLLQPQGRLYFSSLLHTAPYFRDHAWHRFCPWPVHEAHPEMQPVSNAAILTWVDRAIAVRLELLTLMRDRGFDVRAVEAPRPLERAPGIFHVHPDVVRSVDGICRAHIMGRLAAIGVPVVTVPEVTVVDGFTPEAFSPQKLTDPHHGSIKYGGLMMQRILADLERA